MCSADASPAECCQHAKMLEDTQFIDGYKTLGFQETIYGEFLARLRENPRLVASCLVAGERLNQEHTQGVIHNVFTSLYGNCIMQEDESYLLQVRNPSSLKKGLINFEKVIFNIQSFSLSNSQVLRYLVEFELKENDNPRRLLRRGTCAFSILFKLFSEGLYSAKLFLTATLHEPIMQLLVEDEDHLETDPSKVTERLTPAQQERFGEKGSEDYKMKVQAAVEANEVKLVALVNKFIGYLKQNTYCFPHSLRWIVSQMYKTLSCVERLEVGEVRTMCTDLLLTCFICPAIVNPEQYGIISDAPINEVARFNLMQASGAETFVSTQNIDCRLMFLDFCWGRWGNFCNSWPWLMMMQTQGEKAVCLNLIRYVFYKILLLGFSLLWLRLVAQTICCFDKYVV